MVHTVGNELAALLYYFVKMQQQVTFTDDNKPSLHHQLIKPTMNYSLTKLQRPDSFKD